MIRAVIFDCFGVLTTDTWKQFVSSLPPEVNIPRLRELNHQLDAGFITMQEFVSEVQEITGREPVQVESLLNNEVVKNAELLEYVEYLRTKGLKIGMISNVSSNWVRDSFLTSKEQTLFDDMVFSFEVHMTKPDTRIFELACNRLGIDPAQTVMIDDIKSYCEAAESIGMKSVQYIDFGQCKSELNGLLGV